ncbi:MAG: hypothetical protein PF630_02870 [Gammaproteobacteria bacterium]|jgi:hypothetical protein|nr:hypothetical protein [Gammaproteobacteria bacterium]
MKFDKSISMSLLFVVIVILLWTTFIVYSIGYDTFLTILRGENKVQIESFGQMGASYGVLAAIFAGLAIVLLRQSISVQQEELNQLRQQMEHDRNIREFTWIIDAFQGARNRLKNEDKQRAIIANVFNKSDRVFFFESDEYIYNEADAYLNNRKKGNFNNSDDIQLFIDFYVDNGASLTTVLMPFDTYHAAMKQIAIFISKSDMNRQEKYLGMFASVTNKSDLIIIHEQALLRRDRVLIELLEETGLLGVHGSELHEEMAGGPRLQKCAFGIK